MQMLRIKSKNHLPNPNYSMNSIHNSYADVNNCFT